MSTSPAATNLATSPSSSSASFQSPPRESRSTSLSTPSTSRSSPAESPSRSPGGASHRSLLSPSSKASVLLGRPSPLSHTPKRNSRSIPGKNGSPDSAAHAAASSLGGRIDAAFIPPNTSSSLPPPHLTSPQTSTPAVRPLPPPPDPWKNGPKDFYALIPLTLIVLATLATLWHCIPQQGQWNAPLSSSSSLSFFEYPGQRCVMGSFCLTSSSNPSSSSDSLSSAGPISTGRFLSPTAVIPGTRAVWHVNSRKGVRRKLERQLLRNSFAILTGAKGAGRSTVITDYIDYSRDTSDEITDSPKRKNTNSIASSSSAPKTRYSMILWFQATSVESLHAQFLTLHTYLQLGSFGRYDRESIAQGIHAWMMHQDEKWMIVFEECRIVKSQLETFLPKHTRGGHTIVVLDSSNPKGAIDPSAGFDLDDVVHVPSLSYSSSKTILSKLLPTNTHNITETLAKSLSTSALMTFGLYVRRGGIAAVEEYIRNHTTSTMNAQQILLGMVLNEVDAKLRQKFDTGFRMTSVIVYFLHLLTSNGSANFDRAFDRRLFVWMLAAHADKTSDDPPYLKSSALALASSYLDAVVRELATLALVSEHSTALATSTETTLYFAGWMLDTIAAVRPDQNEGVARVGTGSKSLEFELHRKSGQPASYIIGLHALLLDTSADNSNVLPPLIRTLSIPTDAAFFAPTLSVVSAVQELPLSRPQQYYTSVFASISEAATHSPLSKVDTTNVMHILQSAYGRTSLERVIVHAYQAARGSLLLSHLLPILPQLSVGNSLDILLALTSFQADILHDYPRALAMVTPLLDKQTANADANTPKISLRLATLMTTSAMIRLANEDAPTKPGSTQALDLILQQLILARDMRTKLGMKLIGADYSPIAYVHALQQNLQLATQTYAEGLKLDEVSGLNESVYARLRQPSSFSSASSSSTSPTDQAILLHLLRYIRDISSLAYLESALAHYKPAQERHQRAYELELGLYGEHSLAAVSRWLAMGHVDSSLKETKVAHEYYLASVEYLKELLGDGGGESVSPTTRDHRVIRGLFYLARSHNAIGHGRSGRRDLELALDLAIASYGGETHLAVVPYLDELGSTAYVLSQYNDAMGYFRRILTTQQVLLGESHQQTQETKQRVLSIYQQIQQNEAEHKRKQQLLQQEQMKRLREVQQRLAQEQAAKKVNEKGEL